MAIKSCASYKIRFQNHVWHAKNGCEIMCSGRKYLGKITESSITDTCYDDVSSFIRDYKYVTSFIDFLFPPDPSL